MITIYAPEKFASAEDAIRVAVRATGCTCNPEFEIQGALGPGDIERVTVHHDNWCALLRRLEDVN